MHTVARSISVLLHPVFMPIYILGAALWLDPQLGFFLHAEGRYIALAMVLVMTVIFPLTSTLLLLKAGLITGFDMHSREERITPFAMTLLYYGMTYYLLRQSPLHPAVLSIFAGIIAAMLLTIMITIWWKISIHMVGIGGFLGAITGLSVIHSLGTFPLIAILILLAGILGTARAIAGSHQPGHIYAGVLLGFVSTYFCVVLEFVV